MTQSPPTVATKIANMLEHQSFGVISTLRQHQPFQHIMAHAYSDDLRNIYFATKSNNAFGINIQEQPSVNILWDNRTGDVEEEILDAYITASGFASKLGDMKARMAKSMILSRHPNLAQFIEETAVTIYSVQIHTYHYHNHTDETEFYHPNKVQKSEEQSPTSLSHSKISA